MLHAMSLPATTLCTSTTWWGHFIIITTLTMLTDPTLTTNASWWGYFLYVTTAGHDVTWNFTKSIPDALTSFRHHFQTFHHVPGLSITPHHAPSLLVHSVPYSVHSVNIPVLHYHFRHYCFSPLFSVSLCTPFLSIVLRFYPYPISVCHSPFLPIFCFYPFILHFCLAVSWTKLFIKYYY